MKKKKGGFLIRSGMVMIAAAVLWSAYNLYDGYMAGQMAQEAFGYLETVLTPQGEDTALAENGSVYSDVSLIVPTGDEKEEMVVPAMPTEVEIPDYKLNPKMEMPVVHYDGQDYIGVLEIPVLDLKLPVISEWSYARLKKAPCRYVGSAYSSNMVIAAHNYPSHFGNLSQLNEGAAVVFTDVDGNVFNYRVELKETLNPQDVEYMTDSGWDLSLFTCTPGGSYRVTIRCTLRGI